MERFALIDANVFIALNWQDDQHAQTATDIFQKLQNQGFIAITNNYLVSEVITVLLLKLKNVNRVTAIAKSFYFPNQYLKVNQIKKKMQLQSLKIFSEQLKPKFSFPDCTLIAQALTQKIRTIFTFDENIRKFPLLKRGYKFFP